MKELIGAAILIAGLYGGTTALKEIHNSIKSQLWKKRLKDLRRFRGSRSHLSI